MNTISTYAGDTALLKEALSRAGIASSGADRFAALIGRANERVDSDGFGGGGPADQTPAWLVSAPGRSELGGNHTDHNLGLALACSIDLDTIAVAARREDRQARLWSHGFPPVTVDLAALEPVSAERETTAALIRGVAAGFRGRGYQVGGFDAVAESRVLPGSGLSSSASVEVLIGTVLNALYNESQAPPTEVAKTGQYAENEFFGKPCGLMDQLASAVGGIIGIDFAAPEQPGVRRLSYSFRDKQLALLIVDTGGSHADLTGEYAAVPAEMRAVAAELGAEVMRGVDAHRLMERLPEIRGRVGDRALLRALHFLNENPRVEKMLAALEHDDLDAYLHLVAESGRSSWMLLQNTYPPHAPREQGVSLALALTEAFFSERGLANGVGAACRVHGGGFAGTIQVYLPLEHVTAYERMMRHNVGRDCVTELAVRDAGALAVAP